MDTAVYTVDCVVPTWPGGFGGGSGVGEGGDTNKAKEHKVTHRANTNTGVPALVIPKNGKWTICCVTRSWNFQLLCVLGVGFG